jgi:DNA polymerase-3 subunit epsilon
MARYAIDASRRTLHGALLDAELLADVYIELIGGRQAALILGGEPNAPTLTIAAPRSAAIDARATERRFTISAEELAAHRAAIAGIGDKAIWLKYLPA